MKYAVGNDGKTLWCWNCKEKILKGKKIYTTPYCNGKFTCKKCKKK